jgi:hypothetical protein
MDRETLRELVVDYREKGYTFSKIAEILREQYGIVKDRQSIHGIYKRAIKNTDEKKELLVNIANLYVLGYKKAEIKNILLGMGIKTSYYTIRNVINENADYMREVQLGYVYKIATSISDGKYLEEIKESIAYKGALPTDKGFKKLLIEAYTLIVKEACTKEIAKVYRDTDDSEIVEHVIDKLGVRGVTVKDIKARL